MRAVPSGLAEWLEHNERSTWRHVADCQTIIDLENRAKDRADEALDAMRVHNGMTLDEFLETKEKPTGFRSVSEK